MTEQKKNVLIIGSGGREHAIGWKIKQSRLLKNLYVSPGNSGTAQIAENLNINPSNYSQLKTTIITKDIDLLIVGPEVPLVEGIHDQLKADVDLKALKIIGPKKKGAMLEGSKLFAKQFMQTYNIPTAGFQNFDADSIENAKQFMKKNTPPFVIKADGLAAGKGVFICQELKEACDILDEIIVKSKFGKAGDQVVIEEFLEGIELSVFILTDGVNYKILPAAKDYKRIGENDTGLNTGGMGAVSPVPFADKQFMEKIKTKIIEPTLEGLRTEKIAYSGFIFFGLIKVNDEPFVIEYNVRLGDPETQAIMPRIKSDFLDVLLKIDSPKEFEDYVLKISSESASTIIITSGGYPENYTKGYPLSGLEKIKNSHVFHAGLKMENDIYKTNGGRVLAITNCAKNLKESLTLNYKDVCKIKFEKLYFRKDIGKDIVK